MQFRSRIVRMLAVAVLAAAMPLAAFAHNDDRDDDDRHGHYGHGHHGHGHNGDDHQRHGLSARAFRELRAAGVDKYLGRFVPATSEVAPGGWTKHTYDTQAGNGPICINGSRYTAFTRLRNPSKVMIYLNGGGACWQNFYNCTQSADQNPPVEAGVFIDAFNTGTEVIDNPLEDWSIVYGSYCDGSVFTGDNAVVDPSFPTSPVRHHRGLRNASAVVDLAKAHFPDANRVLLAGSSAGGSGVALHTPFLARFTYGNAPKLLVYNDAGPTYVNLSETTAIAARARDWDFAKFFPKSCKDCNDRTHFTPLIHWRLRHDTTVRDSYYVVDADAVLRFFLNIPTQSIFRKLVLEQTNILNDAFPDRYKRFIRSGTSVHTTLRGPVFYQAQANGVPLHEWVDDFLLRKKGWKDIVEDLVPTP
jgi:hypothetical protein